MHDGIELEKRKVPSAVICTRVFIPTVRAQAAISGLPDFPFATVPHPISSLEEEELKERARLVADQVIALLSKK